MPSPITDAELVTVFTDFRANNSWQDVDAVKEIIKRVAVSCNNAEDQIIAKIKATHFDSVLTPEMKAFFNAFYDGLPEPSFGSGKQESIDMFYRHYAIELREVLPLVPVVLAEITATATPRPSVVAG